MKVALASAKLINKDLDYNYSQIIKFMRLAKEQNAGLVCFGETFLQGFDCLAWNYEEDRRMAVSVESDIFRSLCRETEALGIDLLFGFVERESERLYSSCALLGGGKLLHRYRRISRGWKEYRITDAHYQEGTSVKPFIYGGKRCLIALCGDIWDFPQRFSLGEDLLFWPVYVNYPSREWAGGVEAEYAAQANLACGNTLLINSLAGDDAHGGCCQFVNGQVQASLEMGTEGLLIVEV